MMPKEWRKTRNSTYSPPIREEAPFNSPHLTLVNAHNPGDRSLSLSQSYRTGSLGRVGTLPEVTQVAEVHLNPGPSDCKSSLGPSSHQTPASLWDLSTLSSCCLKGWRVGFHLASLLHLPFPTSHSPTTAIITTFVPSPL